MENKQEKENIKIIKEVPPKLKELKHEEKSSKLEEEIKESEKEEFAEFIEGNKVTDIKEISPAIREVELPVERQEQETPRQAQRTTSPAASPSEAMTTFDAIAYDNRRRFAEGRRPEEIYSPTMPMRSTGGEALSPREMQEGRPLFRNKIEESSPRLNLDPDNVERNYVEEPGEKKKEKRPWMGEF